MIGNRNRLNNPLSRRLSRHANLSILFKKNDLDIPPLQNTNQSASFITQSDMPASILINNFTHPKVIATRVADQNITQDIPAESKSLARKPDMTSQTPVDSFQFQPIHNSSTDSDPIWRRLQTIFRKHEEKRFAIDSNEVKPVQETPESTSEIDSIPTSQKKYPIVDSGGIKPETNLVTNLPIQKSDSPSIENTKVPQVNPSPEQPSISAKPELQLTSINDDTGQSLPLANNKSFGIIHNKHISKEPSQVNNLSIESQQNNKLSENNNEIVPSPIQAKSINLEPIEKVTLPEMDLESIAKPIDSEISISPEDEIPPLGEFIDNGYAHFITLANSHVPDFLPEIDTPQPEIGEVIFHSPESSSDSITKTEKTHPHPIPLEQAWQVKSTFSPSPIQRTEFESNIEDPQEPIDQLSSEEHDVNHQSIVNQILKEVSPAQPSVSSVEVIHPRQPRPMPAIQKSPFQTTPSLNLPHEFSSKTYANVNTADTKNKESENLSQSNITTEIGKLPADLWQLLGESPPHKPIQKTPESGSPEHQHGKIDQSLMGDISSPPLTQVDTTDSFSKQTSITPVPVPTITTPVQLQSQSTPSAATPGKEESASDADEDKGKKDKEIMELARKVYLEIRKRLSIENERFRLS